MRNSIIAFPIPILLLVLFSCGNNTTGPSESIVPGMYFVSISGGEFQMGAPEDEVDSNADERPVHTVEISYSFEIMTTEVTQGAWEDLMGSIPPQEFGEGSNYPVYNVSWQDCQDFITEINNLDPDYYYRLPTESEWEYCCRAGTSTGYYWGDGVGNFYYQFYGWFGYTSSGETHPVAEKRANSWGLYDMSGNVSEWCQDWSHFNYEGAPVNGEAWESPETADRIFRGGSHRSELASCRSAFRDPANPEVGHDDIGFRLVRVEL